MPQTRSEAPYNVRHGALAPDAVVCPVCLIRFNCITAGHFRKHGFPDAATFKRTFSLTTLKAPSLCARHALLMTEANPNRGKRHSADVRHKMSERRSGKGLGVAGKYDRTPEIRSRISKGVSAFLASQPDSYPNRHFRCGWVATECSAPEVWVRSSWERRVLRVLDAYEEVEHVTVEPFTIPYIFEGSTRYYTPDLLVEFQGPVREVWEIKPACLTGLPKNVAKFAALEAFAGTHGMNMRVVTLEDIARMEQQTFLTGSSALGTG